MAQNFQDSLGNPTTAISAVQRTAALSMPASLTGDEREITLAALMGSVATGTIWKADANGNPIAAVPNTDYTNPTGLNAAVSGGLPFSAGLMPGLNWFSATQITPQTDNTGLASWPNSGTNAGSATLADAAVQATGANQPKYRTSTAPNSKPCVTFDGSASKMATAIGGSSLTASFYMAAFVSVASTKNQNIISWGNQSSNGNRRSMFLGGSAQLALIGESADYTAQGITYSTATWFLFEIVYNSATNIVYIYKNGILASSGNPSATLNSFATTAIEFGINPNGGEFLNGSVAELWFGNFVPTWPQRQKIYAYTDTTYLQSISPATNVGFGAIFSGTNAISESGSYYEAAGLSYLAFPLIIGDISQYTSLGGLQTGAALSVNGCVVAKGGGNEHLLTMNSSNANVLAIQQLSTAGYSAMRCIDSSSHEKGAFGYGNASAGQAVFQSRLFMESSTDGVSSGSPVEIGIVQTGAINSQNGSHLRQQFKTNGQIVFNQVNAAFPSQNPMLTLDGAANTIALGTSTTLGIATNVGLVMTNQVSGPGAGAGTLTNAPSAGNPNFWLPISINATTHYVPAWHT